jgi:hypothetical protein
MVRWWHRNHQQNYFHGWRLESLANTFSVDSKIINENWVVADSEIINEIASSADAWICQRTQNQGIIMVWFSFELQHASKA